MKFWEIIFRILLLPLIPLRVRIYKYPDASMKVIHVLYMPWAQAFCIGHLVFTTLSPEEYAENGALRFHEYQHILQWQEEGFMFLPRYVASSVKALFSGKRPYYDNKYEEQAYKAEYEYRKDKGLPYSDRYQK